MELEVVIMDPRVWELAEILVDYSVGVQDGDVVMISADLDGSQLMEVVYRRVLQRGRYPRFKVSMPEVTRVFYAEASQEQLATLLPIDLTEYEASDCLLSISETANVSPAKMGVRRRAVQPVSDWLMKSSMRWCCCNFPCNTLAQKDEMSLGEYEDFIFGATNVDWPEIIEAPSGGRTVLHSRQAGHQLRRTLQYARWRGLLFPCGGLSGRPYHLHFPRHLHGPRSRRDPS